jgi:hypothetical protein
MDNCQELINLAIYIFKNDMAHNYAHDLSCLTISTLQQKHTKR